MRLNLQFFGSRGSSSGKKSGGSGGGVGGSGGAGGGGGATTATAQAQPTQPTDDQQTTQPTMTKKPGVNNLPAFVAATPDEQAQMISDAVSKDVPAHLNNTSDLQKVLYNLGLGGQPEVVSDSELASQSGQDVYRTVNAVYNRSTDVNFTAPQIANQVIRGRSSYVASDSTGGAAYGEGLYFATTAHESALYGNTYGDVTKTCIMHGKIKPHTNSIDYYTAYRSAQSETGALGRALKRMDGEAAAAVWALTKGYQVMVGAGGEYQNVLDRSVLVMSDKVNAI